MRIPNHIRRLLLAVLIVLPALTMARSADHARDGQCKVLRTAERPGTGNVYEHHHAPLQDAVLSGTGWTSSGVCAPQGYAGGAGSGIVSFPVIACCLIPPYTTEGPELRRRWRVLSGVIHRDLLLALYPTHGFW
jgi:hypothetical protein